MKATQRLTRLLQNSVHNFNCQSIACPVSVGLTGLDGPSVLQQQQSWSAGRIAIRRTYSTSWDVYQVRNPPAGIPSMLKLPVRDNTTELDVCFVGVPLDCGTWNRPGARFGPRHIRMESSTLADGYNLSTGAAPFESLRVADVGDIKLNPHRVDAACADIKSGFEFLIQSGCRTLAMGGDHLMTYPILQAYAAKYGPVGMIHIDSHSDVWDAGAEDTEKLFHGSPFRRAVESGCLDTKRVVQIGLRGYVEGPQHFDWPRQKGFRQVLAAECYYKSLAPLMDEVRQQMGSGPVYLTFDIDGVDPAFAPGTGTPEVGGLTSIQALEIVRGCRGLNIVGGDLVEVSPPYDPTGTTAYLAANLLLEMLCIMPGVRYYK